MYFDEFAKKCTTGKFPPLVLMAGDAEDVLGESLRLLRSGFRKTRPSGTVRVLDGTDQDLASLLDEARSSSLSAADQLLVLRRAEKRLGQRQSDAALELLKDYLADPNPLSIVALVARGMRKDSRLARLASEKGWFVQCGEMPSWKAVPWIVDQAAGMGLTIREETAALLHGKVGNDLGLLRSALEQLGVALHPAREVRRRDVETLPVPGGEPEVFAFLDSVAQNRTRRALRWLSEVRSSSSQDAEDGLLFMLYGRIRDLLQVAACREEGLSEPDAARAIPMHPFRLKNLWEPSKRLSCRGWEKALARVIRLMGGQVTGRFTKDAALKGMDLWLLRSRGGARPAS